MNHFAFLLSLPKTCLLDQEVATGATRVVWDISRDAAERIPGGVYFLSLSTGAHESVRRIAVLR